MVDDSFHDVLTNGASLNVLTCRGGIYAACRVFAGGLDVRPSVAYGSSPYRLPFGTSPKPVFLRL